MDLEHPWFPSKKAIYKWWSFGILVLYACIHTICNHNFIVIPYAPCMFFPICAIFRVNVGKYSSTMEHLGITIIIVLIIRHRHTYELYKHEYVCRFGWIHKIMVVLTRKHDQTWWLPQDLLGVRPETWDWTCPQIGRNKVQSTGLNWV